MERQITEEELKTCDGRDGRPAYAAVRGKIYDLSKSRLWPGGVHQSHHQAGRDLTTDFGGAPHDESVFKRVPSIGTLVAAKSDGVHPLLRFYLDLHVHPIAVHFPIALTLASAGFLVLYLPTDIESLVDGAYYTLLAAAIMSPIAILAGVSSWWYNYQHKLTSIYKGKASLSIMLFVLQFVTLIVWATNRNALSDRKPIGWLYLALVIIMSGFVFGLGKLGGEIVFPPRRKPGRQV